MIISITLFDSVEQIFLMFRCDLRRLPCYSSVQREVAVKSFFFILKTKLSICTYLHLNQIPIKRNDIESTTRDKKKKTNSYSWMVHASLTLDYYKTEESMNWRLIV